MPKAPCLLPCLLAAVRTCLTACASLPGSLSRRRLLHKGGLKEAGGRTEGRKEGVETRTSSNNEKVQTAASSKKTQARGILQSLLKRETVSRCVQQYQQSLLRISPRGEGGVKTIRSSNIVLRYCNIDQFTFSTYTEGRRFMETTFLQQNDPAVHNPQSTNPQIRKCKMQIQRQIHNLEITR